MAEELETLVHFTKPLIESIHSHVGVDGYVVCMHKLSNKGLNCKERLERHFYDFIDWNGYQIGYCYNIIEGFPVRVLNSLRILKDAGCIRGYDIDDKGIIGYCEEDEND